MVDKRRSTPLQVQRGGRYLQLNRASAIAKRKASCRLPSPSNAAPYKGVRMRVWGKWVTEIRDPVTKTRIWLGSFATAEMAARAYDAAVVCLKGPCAPEVNFPDSIPSFVVPQCNSSPKEIQAVALAAATASVPAAAPLAMAAPDQTQPREESEALPQITAMADAEFHRDVDDGENGSKADIADMELLHPDVDNGENTSSISELGECSSSNVENWINKVFEELDALDDEEDPLSRYFSELVEQPLFSWPMSEDYDDAADYSMMHHDTQLWSFP